MVKSALQRSGAGNLNTPVAKTAEPEAFGAQEMAPPKHSSVPTVEVTPAPEFHMEGTPDTSNVSFVEEIPPKPEPLEIDSSAQPFGSLLETPAETAEEVSRFATTTAPEFAMEHDWRDRDEATESEEADEEPAAWRPEGTGDEEEVSAANTKKPKSNVSDWRTGGFEQIAASKSRNTGWEPEEEENPTPLETAPAASSPAPQKPAVPPAPAKEVTPIPIPVASKPFVADTWAPPSPPPVAPATPMVMNQKPSPETATAVVEDKPKPSVEPKPAEKKEGKDSWFSVSSSP